MIIDAHCDWELTLPKNQADFGSSISKIGLQVIAIFIKKQPRSIITFDDISKQQENLLQSVRYQDDVKWVTKRSQLRYLSSSQLGILLALEGGDFVYDLTQIETLYDRGIRMMSLTWNEDNNLATGAFTNTDHGLSLFGQEVVERMEKLGIIIDLAHLSVNSVKDVIHNATKPLIISHGNCYGKYAHKRNFTDTQIRDVAATGGVIGITFVPDFLCKPYYVASIDDVVAHIHYAVKLVGIEHVGIGSDFNGMRHVTKGLEDVTKIDILIEKLKKKGFLAREVECILGNNFLRVFQEIIK